MLFSPSLPQHEPIPILRFARLEIARFQYHYSYTLINNVAMAAKVPMEELPSIKWLLHVGEVLAHILINNASANQDFEQVNQIRAERAVLDTALQQGGSNALILLGSMIKNLSTQVATQHVTGAGNNFTEFTDLFESIPVLSISQGILEDSVFARLRLAGYNPAVIQHISADDAAKIFGSAILETGVDKARLFLTDYSLFTGLKAGNEPSQKSFWAAKALFSVVFGKLAPVAILIPDLPLFTPPAAGGLQDWGWQMAKVAVAISDANHHELVSHLALTHLVAEAFVVTSNRQLAPNHPLHILLSSHFEGTININSLAQSQLVADGGPIGQLLAFERTESLAIAGQALERYHFNASLFPNDLKRRGVEDPEILPDYPYRDDGLALWQAIHTWVTAYINLYYPNDSTLLADGELQAWIVELASHSGGRLQDIGESGAIRTRGYLYDLVTQIIFLVSVQHAAVNFTQASIMAYAPAAPLAGYSLLPASGSTVSEKQFFDLLPSRDQALRQLNVLHFLGSVYYKPLGEYPDFLDSRVHAPLLSFQLALLGIEVAITNRNSGPAGLLQPVYNVLLPNKIPQSINI